MTIQSLFSIIASIFFIISYILISLEHNLKINKSGVALFAAGFLWLLVALSGKSKSFISHSLEKAGSEIFDLIIFLLAAMILVEILIKYNFFDFIRIKLHKLNLDDKKQFILINLLTFFLSAFLDNITVGIVMIQTLKRFFKGKNLLIAAASVIVMANAGGAWSPLGDVTTIMIWLAGKFSASQIILWGFLPSLTFALVFIALMSKNIIKNTKDSLEDKEIYFTRGEKLVIIFTLLGFLFPLVMNFFGLKPYIGLIFGLGLVWILIELLQIRSTVKTHLENDIEILIKNVDFPSLKFFIGILLSVSALNALGILYKLSLFLFGTNPDVSRIINGSIILGILSAIVDNVPLTAVGLDIIKTTDPRLWTLFALTVGTGGSLLLIGSAVGVIAMGIIKELTFKKYFQIAFFPSLTGYFLAIGIWYMQYLLLH